MAWEENSRICLHMQLIAILSRIGVYFKASAPFRACGEKLAKLESFFKENVPLNTPMYPYVPTANSGCRNFAL